MDRRQILLGGGAVALAGAGAAYAGRRHMGSMEEYEASVAETRSVLTASPQLRDFIRYATLAPNGHNTQPWRFRIRQNSIDVLPDFSRRTPVVDPDDHHLFVSLGGAAENLALAATAVQLSSRREARWMVLNTSRFIAAFLAVTDPAAPAPMMRSVCMVISRLRTS